MKHGTLGAKKFQQGGKCNMMKQERCQYMIRRIGSTTYKVKVVFDDSGGETMEDKIIRLIQNEGLAMDGNCGILKPPQMSRPA